MQADDAITLQTHILFHAIIRQDQSDEELARSMTACKWMAENLHLLVRYMPDADCEAIGLGINYFLKKKTPASMDIIELDTMEEHIPRTEEFLTEYRQFAKEGLPLMRTPEDMDHAFARLVTAVQVRSISRIASVGNQIAMSVRKGVEVTSPSTGEKIQLKGPEGARQFISEALAGRIHQDPFALRNRSHEPGDWRDDPSDAVTELMEAPAERIPTNIRPIDDAVAIRKGELIGILGYTGCGKSRLGRTMSYNAMRDGRNVLHIVTEGGGRKVERVRYAVAHAHYLDPERAQALCITFKAYADQILNPEAMAFLQDAIQDLSRHEGGITVVSPMERTWQGVRRIIEAETRKRKIDLLNIDYLTHLVPTTARDPRTAMATVIHEAQDLAAVYDHGKGLALLTPVQGNRKGYEAAQSAGGAWTSEGLFEYSAFVMDCDLLLYVYADDDLRPLNQIKIGTAKARSSIGMPCTTFKVDKFTQMVVNPTSFNEDFTMDDVLELI